jgi:hypothetical protein
MSRADAPESIGMFFAEAPQRSETLHVKDQSALPLAAEPINPISAPGWQDPLRLRLVRGAAQICGQLRAAPDHNFESSTSSFAYPMRSRAHTVSFGHLFQGE